jgi:transposase
MIESAASAAKRFPTQIKQLLQQALRLRDRHADGEVGERGLAVARGRLDKRVDRLLQWTRANPANERLAKHLHKHRDQLLTFLHWPGIDATNYRGEQAIRPAVVNRKVWGGNRTAIGASAQSILMSILRSCVQQHRDALCVVSDILRDHPACLALPPSVRVTR